LNIPEIFFILVAQISLRLQKVKIKGVFLFECSNFNQLQSMGYQYYDIFSASLGNIGYSVYHYDCLLLPIMAHFHLHLGLSKVEFGTFKRKIILYHLSDYI
jgi:hypothetical protein